MAQPNSRKESISENKEEKMESSDELSREQPMGTQLGSNRIGSSDQDMMSSPESLNNNHYLNTGPTKNDDKAVLTDNRSPSPLVSKSESTHQKRHPRLVLKVSNDSFVSVPINDGKKPLEKTKSVITKGGRLVRNISMNKSVKYDIDTAYNKYTTDFSHYDNVFRSGSMQQTEKKPSLKRDGQVRRASRHERTNSERSLSTSSSEAQSNQGKHSTFIHQTSTDSCTSVSSNTQLVTNPYNFINHKISSIVWCPCFFFFCFCCCAPGYWYMKRSDLFFDEGYYDKARTYAKLSTFLYILGMILSVAFLAGIFAVIIIFAT